ncbi:hypothetical protein L596_027761 [Steinernema carpocapsae]|uniref:Uncharacterized protein n=1 Tax=Steinernema carpocapsae TaxID=34508 RepID=A0A4U5LWH1_STECR|nr:hypothetical protein L596_027761 [Steinernema carpocapsae]
MDNIPLLFGCFLSSQVHVQGMIDHGGGTFANISENFEGVITNVNFMVNEVNTRVGPFPVNAFYALLIVSLILLVVALLFLVMHSSHRYVTYRTHKKKQANENSLIA